MKNTNVLWENNAIQFPRLLCEIMATQQLDCSALAESMDLEVDAIKELFERANEAWESAKAFNASAGASNSESPGKEIVVRVAADYEPEDGDAFDAVQAALEHFGIPAMLVERLIAPTSVAAQASAATSPDVGIPA